MAKRKHKAYKFRGLSHSVDGMISCGLGMVSICVTVAEMIWTIRMRGTAGRGAGYLGFAAFLFSIVGTVFAVMSWKDQETEDVSKHVGTLMNGCMILISVTLIVLGIINWN